MDTANQAHSSRPPAFSVMLLALAAIIIFGATRSNAQVAQEEVVVVEAAAPLQTGPTTEELESVIAEQEALIAALEEQVAIAQQATLKSEDRVDTQRETILKFQQSEEFATASAEAAFDEWRIGYAIGGGQNLSAFENIILPCESGGEIDPDAAIGPTDDWGRAQINRPTWKNRFEELTGFEFETWIREPILNGYMAAVVEEEQTNGLNAWTCWRKR
jgi:uncharacterized coiled-coil protein SlyX